MKFARKASKLDFWPEFFIISIKVYFYPVVEIFG